MINDNTFSCIVFYFYLLKSEFYSSQYLVYFRRPAAADPDPGAEPQPAAAAAAQVPDADPHTGPAGLPARSVTIHYFISQGCYY